MQLIPTDTLQHGLAHSQPINTESLKTSYQTYFCFVFSLKPTDNVSQGFLQQKSHHLFVRRQTLSCGMQKRDGIEIVIAPHRIFYNVSLINQRDFIHKKSNGF